MCEDSVFTFPGPQDKDSGSYSVGELLAHFKAYDFIIPALFLDYLRNHGYTGISKRSMYRKINEYKQTNSLSSVKGDTSQIVPKSGRPANIDISQVMAINNKVKENISLTTSRIEDAKKALCSPTKTSTGMTKQNKKSPETIMNYDSLAVMLDKDISEAPLSSVRIKTESRHIASRSIRTCMTQTLTRVLYI